MKSALRTLLLAGVFATGTQAIAFEGTCDSVEDCGEPENPPYYYDWTYKPSSMYWITRVSYLQSTIVPLVFLYDSYNEYRQVFGKKPADL